MNKCRFCGSPVIQIRPRFFKCVGSCGQYFRENPTGPLPKMKIVTDLETLKAHEAGITLEKEITTGGLSSDMLIFVDRVAQKLMPGDPKLQEKYRKGLAECLIGTKDFQEWFNNTGADLGIHSWNLLKTLHDALDLSLIHI